MVRTDSSQRVELSAPGRTNTCAARGSPRTVSAPAEPSGIRLAASEVLLSEGGLGLREERLRAGTGRRLADRRRGTAHKTGRFRLSFPKPAGKEGEVAYRAARLRVSFTLPFQSRCSVISNSTTSALSSSRSKSSFVRSTPESERAACRFMLARIKFRR